jgi:hypothetical protein
MLVVAPGPLHLFLKDTVEKTAVVEAVSSSFRAEASFWRNRLISTRIGLCTRG